MARILDVLHETRVQPPQPPQASLFTPRAHSEYDSTRSCAGRGVFAPTKRGDAINHCALRAATGVMRDARQDG